MYKGRVGVKKPEIFAYVLYGWPQTIQLFMQQSVSSRSKYSDQESEVRVEVTINMKMSWESSAIGASYV